MKLVLADVERRGEPADAALRGTGWFAAAVPLGGFGRAARGGRPGAAALAAAKCWAVGAPVRVHGSWSRLSASERARAAVSRHSLRIVMWPCQSGGPLAARSASRVCRPHGVSFP